MNLFNRIFGKKEIVPIDPEVEDDRYYINNYVGEKATGFHTFLGKWHENKQDAIQESVDLNNRLNYKYTPLRKDILKTEVEKIANDHNMTIEEALSCVPR